jgi:serpin B
MASLGVVCILSLLACASCGTDHGTPVRPPGERAYAEATEEARRTGPEPVEGVTEAQSSALASAANSFSVELWRSLGARDGNLAVSSGSISLALAMTWAGARGETASQMAEKLHFDDTGGLHGAAANLLARWNDPERDSYELRVANRLFGDRAFAIEKEFLALTRDRYGAGIEGLDFRGAAERSRSRINGWVAGQTRDRIRDLLPKSSIDEGTRLVLVNAVYFLGRWQAPFETEATSDAVFHRSGGEPTVRVPTMHRTGSHRYAETDELQVLELPYEGADFAMTLLLPRAVHGCSELEGQLSADQIARWIGALGYEPVEVAIPRFEIDPAEPLRLAGSLRAMGMELAFDPRAADFTGIAKASGSEDRLFIAEVFHKAFVKVDEAGTEAAAATAVDMGPTAAAPPFDEPPPPKVFRADHPFLFLIRDVRSGVILFTGRVSDPSARS